MAKIIETQIDKWNGGVVLDPRDRRENVCQALTNFDVLTFPNKMVPYRDSEDGDSAATTSAKENWTTAIFSGSGTSASPYVWRLYALGRVSGESRAEILTKALTTGAANDLDDNGWATPSGNYQSASGATDFELFVYYRKTGRIYGAKTGTDIWSVDSTFATAFIESETAISYNTIAQGLVHSKDDILYIPYDNKIAKNDNGNWTNEAIVLPSHFEITSICEYGNYIAIACQPISNNADATTAGTSIGKSRVFLWDRNSSLTTLSESIEWGEENLRILEEIDGFLVGVSISASVGASNQAIRHFDRIIFRAYSPQTGVRKFEEFLGALPVTAVSIPIVGNFPLHKQKYNGRLYFMLRFTFKRNLSETGITREGVWSVGRSGDRFSIIHERTPNNDTALVATSSVALMGFYIVGDYMFIAYISGGTRGQTKTNDTASFTATSIWESQVFNGGDASKQKDLTGLSVMHDYLPTAGSVLVRYKKDEDIFDGTDWQTILTNTTDNSLSASVASGASSMPKDYKEIQFRLESTGGAEITAFSFRENVKDTRPY